MPRLAPSRARLGVLAAGLLIVSGCGSSQPEALKPMPPEIPADLCSTVPPAAKAGLVSNASSDPTGNPTAACSLRSPDGSAGQVRAVVTWLQLNDDISAGEVLDSQCRAIDRTTYKERASFSAPGADRACAASGTVDRADSATMAALAGRQVVTVRLSSLPPGRTPAFEQARQMLDGVLSSMAG